MDPRTKARQLAMQGQHLARRHPALVTEQLGQVPDSLPRGEIAQRCAQDRARAGAGMRQPQQQLDRGRLAGAVGSEEPVDLARPDIEVDPVDGGEASITLAISIAVIAASAPALPFFAPALSTASSSVSQVSTPNTAGVFES